MGPIIIHPATGFVRLPLLVADCSPLKLGCCGLLRSSSQGLLAVLTPGSPALLCWFNRCFRRFMVSLLLFFILSRGASTHFHLDKRKRDLVDNRSHISLCDSSYSLKCLTTACRHSRGRRQHEPGKLQPRSAGSLTVDSVVFERDRCGGQGGCCSRGLATSDMH